MVLENGVLISSFFLGLFFSFSICNTISVFLRILIFEYDIRTIHGYNDMLSYGEWVVFCAGGR